jgi:hypothetical protein
VNHPELITAIYERFQVLKQKWDESVSAADNIGVLVFKLEAITDARSSPSLDSEFWPLPEAQAYLTVGKQSDEGLLDMLFAFDFDQEFLAMIIECDGDDQSPSVYIHKISRIGLS